MTNGDKDDRKPSAAPVHDPVIAVPPWLLARYNARVLDPALGTQVAGQPQLRPTVYLADKLLVSGRASEETRAHLADVARRKNLSVYPPLEFDQRRTEVVEAARQLGHDEPETRFTTLHHLSPARGSAVTPDAWDLLQTFRASIDDDHPGKKHVGLDHLLTATKFVHGSPFDLAAGSAPIAAGSYGEPGWGGRQPVNVVGLPPARRDDPGCRRPVVAVLDTGVGEHDWFPLNPETVVHRNQKVGGTALGLGEPSLTEKTGVIEHPLEGILDPYSGHGTFIAGLIHQECPDADILSIRVMPSEGAVPEHVLLEALNLLVCRQQAAQRDGDAAGIIDVVSLSLGYYHEQVGSTALDPLLLEPIDALGRCGVAVVVAAGNDATNRPMYPAAFTPHAGGLVSATDPGCVPVVSVGAQNPDGSIALFSNQGAWVTCTQPGAALVSTFPKFNAAGQSAYGFRGPDGWRATIDPDSFTSGFGVWSGTSFAAPVLAGKIAKSLVDGTCGSTDEIGADTMVTRGWGAVSIHTKLAPS